MSGSPAVPKLSGMRRCFTLRLRRRLLDEGAFGLIELVVTMAILGTVLAALTGLFASASKSEADLNNRFRAQEQGRLALDKIRREVHCASAVTPNAGAATSLVTITLGGYCQTSGLGGDATQSTTATWCTLPSTVSSTTRYALWRVPGTIATCTSTGGIKWADYLTTQTVFTPVASTSTSLAKLGVCLPVNTTFSASSDTCTTRATRATYALADDVVLRNTLRQ
jgi:type II secretory pathway pseudopilin PulG